MFVVSFSDEGGEPIDRMFESRFFAEHFARQLRSEGIAAKVQELKVNVLLLDRESGTALMAANALEVRESLAWTLEYLGRDTRRSIILEPTEPTRRVS